MRIANLAVLGGLTLAAAVAAVQWARAPASRARVQRAEAEANPQPSVVTVIRERVIERAEPEQPEARAQAEPARAGKTPEEAVVEMHREFEALPRNPREEAENESLLRGTLARAAKGARLPIQAFECRDAACRVEIDFENAEQVRTTMQDIAYDQEWMQAGFGFNVVQQDPLDPESTNLVVYFTRAKRPAEETGS